MALLQFPIKMWNSVSFNPEHHIKSRIYMISISMHDKAVKENWKSE